MENKTKVWLYDILNAIHEIEIFMEPQHSSFEIYQSDLKTRRAIERNLEIIGEAMNNILKHNPTIIITDSRKVVDLRNRIIHGYDTVSDKTIWSVAIKSIPILKTEVEALLGE